MMKVYGISVSYYTGKLEAYLRYKGIDYEMESPYHQSEKVIANAGALQVPVVEREDGRWMSDSTPIILQLEKEQPTPSVIPDNPVVRYISRLIEDYADEWLWRPAMHYRWSYEHDRELLSRILVDELAEHVRAPRFFKLRMIRKRQHTGFVLNDGVTDATRSHVETGYLAALANMSTMLAERPYLLGQTPSIADFGLMGPMLRHFGQDPTPAEIMRNQGPAVFDWLSRVWNARDTAGRSMFLSTVPEDAAPMLREIAETHLVQLRDNAIAFGKGQRHFDMAVQGCAYQHLPVSRYRVYCLEKLRDEYAALSEADQDSVRALLPWPGAGILWQDSIGAESGYDAAGEAPFNKAINVYGDGVPG